MSDAANPENSDHHMRQPYPGPDPYPKTTLTPDEWMQRICSNCGLTWGAHRADPTNEECPGHEGRMDFAEGPGTVFDYSGEVGLIEAGMSAGKPPTMAEREGFIRG